MMRGSGSIKDEFGRKGLHCFLGWIKLEMNTKLRGLSGPLEIQIGEGVQGESQGLDMEIKNPLREALVEDRNVRYSSYQRFLAHVLWAEWSIKKVLCRCAAKFRSACKIYIFATKSTNCSRNMYQVESWAFTTSREVLLNESNFFLNFFFFFCEPEEALVLERKPQEDFPLSP